jgi:hypothetical protein
MSNSSCPINSSTTKEIEKRERRVNSGQHRNDPSVLLPSLLPFIEVGVPLSKTNAVNNDGGVGGSSGIIPFSRVRNVM